MIGDGKTGNLNKIAKTNKPTLTDDVTLALRAITEKRASTMTYMLDQADQGDDFARQAVWQYGLDNGDDFKASMDDPDDLQEFADKFTHTLEANVYEMKTTKNTDKEFDVQFHYCPYVNRWLRMGKDPKELSQLCDICMLGDQATASKFEHVEFNLGETIAKGNDFCDLKYVKRNKN